MTYRESFDLEERRVTAEMEMETQKYGGWRCDYNAWIADIEERRKKHAQAGTLDAQVEYGK